MSDKILTKGSIGGLEIFTPQQIEPKVNLLIYGDPGVGKTTLAASASAVVEMSPVLIIDVEGGTLSLRKSYPGVDTVRVKSFRDFNQLFADIRSSGKYKTIILDSLTEIQKFGMYSIMQKAVKDDPDRDPDLPQIGDWGKNIEQTRKLVRAFRDLPCNVIFTALAMGEQDRKGNVKNTKPSLSGKLSSEVAGFLDIVVFMYKKNVSEDPDRSDIQRMLLTVGTDAIIAKDRSDNLPPVIVDPKMETLYQMIHANLTTNKEETNK